MKSTVVFGANVSGKTNLILDIEKLEEIIFNGINLPKGFNEKNLNYNSKSIKFEIGILDKNNNSYDYSIEFQKEKLIYEKLECNNKLVYEFKDDVLSSTETILKKLKDFQLEEINNFVLSLSNIIVKKTKK